MKIGLLSRVVNVACSRRNFWGEMPAGPERQGNNAGQFAAIIAIGVVYAFIDFCFVRASSAPYQSRKTVSVLRENESFDSRNIFSGEPQ